MKTPISASRKPSYHQIGESPFVKILAMLLLKGSSRHELVYWVVQPSLVQFNPANQCLNVNRELNWPHQLCSIILSSRPPDHWNNGFIKWSLMAITKPDERLCRGIDPTSFSGVKIKTYTSMHITASARTHSKPSSRRLDREHHKWSSGEVSLDRWRETIIKRWAKSLEG